MTLTAATRVKIERVYEQLRANGTDVHGYDHTGEKITFQVAPPTTVDLADVPAEIDGLNVVVEIRPRPQTYVKEGA
jgi:hypothetical protein